MLEGSAFETQFDGSTFPWHTKGIIIINKPWKCGFVVRMTSSLYGSERQLMITKE